MISKSFYNSPLGDIVLEVSDGYLTGLAFSSIEDQDSVSENLISPENSAVLEKTKRWLDIYFSGKEPDFIPRIKIQGTPFRLAVWKKTAEIPFGKTVSYGDIAKSIEPDRKISPQAVGTALGKNKISIIIPCHRVIGKNGEMKGYAWGVDRKSALIELEKK